ncbi:MAG TPA: hypothetical protein PLD54_01430 [Candidatus Levybacteria bacterium]|nr:hypothetical protein [Candidatus Levybacteria bacterium]
MTNPEYPLAQQALQEIVSDPEFIPLPAQISMATSTALEFYFSNKVPDKKPVQDFLEDVTLPFLRTAQIGVLSYPHTIDKLGLITPNDRELLNRRQKAMKINTDDRSTHQAFDYTRIAFSALPELTTDPFVPKGFSRRGILAPPLTVRDFIWRVDELGSQISQIKDGAIKPSEIEIPNVALWRTQAFFKVGNELPLHFASRNEFNQMLKDIPIDL